MIDLAIFGVSLRCGSTLVQRAFNLDPRTLVWGENGRMLTHYAAMRDSLQRFCKAGAGERTRYFSQGRSSKVFIPNMNPDWQHAQEALTLGLKVTFSTLYGRGQLSRVGFKEVGHDIDSIKLFREVFPKSEIYFCARNPIDTWRSLRTWQPPNVQKWIANWFRRVDAYMKFTGASDFFWYEDLLFEENGLIPLAEAASVTVEEIKELIDVGKVGGTPDKVKDQVPKEQIDTIIEFIKSAPEGAAKEKVLAVCRSSGNFC